MTLDDFQYADAGFDLAGFIASPLRNDWITDSGLRYYVRKSLFFPGLIELANCSATNDSGLNYWRFNKRHSHRTPFIAEQVLNVGLARFYERQGWIARDGGEGIPSYASPLAVERYGTSERFRVLRFNHTNAAARLAELLEGVGL